jgi:ribosomal subunit interface protein
MTIKVTGKNVELGGNLRSYALGRVESAIVKYAAGRSLSGQVSVEKNHAGFSTQCSIHLASGFDVQSSGSAQDAYGSVDGAIERLEKRLRRYKRRLKSHGQGVGAAETGVDSTGVNYLTNAKATASHKKDGGAEVGAPAVIAEIPGRIRAMTVSNAVIQMDLAEEKFFVFRNAAHGGVNVVYRRPDGNIGWIDPAGVVASGKA